MEQRLRSPSEGADEPGTARYQPGIDGLRALAVLGVLLFHAEVGVHGGFLGVSLFFTLSGYLITTLLLEEMAVTRRVDIRHFLVRRVRRLAPASYVVLALVAVCAPWFAAAGSPERLRGDLFAALGYVANWRFVFTDQSYADLFVGGPSPVLHYWSLAVEEQFYVVYPLVMAWAAWAARWYRQRWIPLATVSTLLVASVCAGLLTNDIDLGYYGAHVRATEILVGALAAFGVRRIGLRRLAARPEPWVLAGGAGLVLFAVMVVGVHRTEGWVLRGGLAAAAVLWSVVIVSCLVPGLVRRALSVGPLVHVGRLSFGLYLYHWPVYLLLSADRLGFGGWALFAVRFAVSLLLAWLSFLLIEHPIRTRRLALRTWRFGAAYLAVVAIAVVAATLHLRPTEASTFDAMLNAPEEVVTFEPPPPEVVVVGNDLAVLARAESAAQAAGMRVVDLVDPACSMLASTPPCVSPSQRLDAYLAANAPGATLAVVMVALGDLDHREVDNRLAAARLVSDEQARTESDQLQRELAFIGHVRDATPAGVLVQVVDSFEGADGADTLSGWLGEAVLGVPGAQQAALADIDGAWLNGQVAGSDASRLRVMVIGDSTSYGVAIDIDRLAGERYDVLWAGFRNCPIVPAVEIRWWEGAQFPTDDCRARQSQWPQLISEFQPDLVLVVTGLSEYSHHRYAGDDTWYRPGDEQFVLQHDAALDRLQAEIAPFGSQVIFTDAQATGDAPDVVAWNGLLASWQQQWPNVTVLPYGAAANAAEAAAGKFLRPDGIHFDDATLQHLVETVVLPGLDSAALPGSSQSLLTGSRP